MLDIHIELLRDLFDVHMKHAIKHELSYLLIYFYPTKHEMLFLKWVMETKCDVYEIRGGIPTPLDMFEFSGLKCAVPLYLFTKGTPLEDVTDCFKDV
jgi:hypothetical protein